MSGSTKWLISLFFFIAVIAILFLPFKISITGGTYTTFFGGIASSEFIRVQKSGLELGFVPLFLLFYLISIVLIGFAKFKGLGILALIAASLNILAMAPLYFALTFELSLWGPKTKSEVGIGYLVLLFFGLVLLIYSIWIMTKLPRRNAANNQNDLLDDQR